ncbi:protein abrupt-like [Anopheles cruzii]|uniref:protein abrupt-like n=1 Tax=Anopheles cruzii TaxID=68878 RepID=UPI0022EC8140|nr:protein abrupt-like [Anopheles cruzii]
MPSIEYLVSWTDSKKFVASAINDIRHDEDFVDVTLSCEGHRIGAHKILLAACSTYFRAVFKENPVQHPVIIFQNVQYSDLKAIVEFVYHGETKIASDQIHSFLSTAEMLSILGLTVSGQKPQQTDAHKSITQQLLQSQEEKTATKTRNSKSSNMAPTSVTVHELLQSQIPTSSKTINVQKMPHVLQAQQQVNVNVAPDTQQVHKQQEDVEQQQQKKQLEELQQLMAMQVEIINDPATPDTQQQADQTELATFQLDLMDLDQLDVIDDDAMNNGSTNNNSLIQELES